MHHMLIAYVSGTLEPEARSSFQGHLSGCDACRTELPVLEKLRSEVEGLGEAAFTGHPDTTELVDAVLPDAAGDLAPARRDEVRRHLDVCSLCAEEAGWVRGDRAAEAPPITESVAPAPSRAGHRHAGGPSWMPAWGWAAAAVLATAVVLVPFIGRAPAPAETGIERLALIEPTQRAAPVSHVEVPAESTAVHFLFRVDLGPDDFPATFEVVNADGEPVHRGTGIEAADLHRDRFLLLTCSRADCRDGRYIGRLISATGSGPAVEYPFSIVTATD